MTAFRRMSNRLLRLYVGDSGKAAFRVRLADRERPYVVERGLSAYGRQMAFSTPASTPCSSPYRISNPKEQDKDR